ncbi:MAG: FAD-dependent oxidoreductase [Firmicutes bacterium]|nr:FAD-dependent oxidoreductase [Bacillota bacterium]
MKMLDTDVVVIGSGPSGLAAACSAAENGSQVLILEKGNSMGGGVKGGNGLFAVESRLQKEKQLAFTKEDAFKFLMDYTHWKVDAQLVSAYINKSASTIAWLENMGINFIDVVAYFIGAQYTWHFKDPASPAFTEAIFEKAKTYGASIKLDTSAKSLIKEENRVVGVIAEDKLWQQIEIRAKAVIIASGGFGGNKDWIKKYTGYEHGVDLYTFAFPEVQGDGIQMAWDAGAGKSDMMMNTHVCLPDPFGGPGGTGFELGSFRQPNLMVNIDGERIMNEEIMRSPGFAGNAVHRQKNGCAFMIFDEAANEYYDTGWDFVMSKLPIAKSNNLRALIKKAQTEGYEHLFMADSLEELSTVTGIELQGLKKTMAEYNQACEHGRDDMFYKQAKYLRPLTKPKFYAARFFQGGYGSLGGIKINCKTEVVTEAGAAIPGLYAVGNDANSIYNGSYPFVISGNVSSFCYNSGRIAGENAAAYIRG